MRISALHKAKNDAETVPELLNNVVVTTKFKHRRDKPTGAEIWTRAWHEFTAVKKGQQFRSKMLKRERVYNNTTKSMVWKSEWARHPKRYMCHKMSEMHQMVLKWTPYLEWRQRFLQHNPNWDQTWHVGQARLCKERCFCVDSKVVPRGMCLEIFVTHNICFTHTGGGV